MGPHSGTVVTFWAMLNLLALVATFGVGAAVSMVFRRWWLSIVLFAAFSLYLLLAAGSRMTRPEWLLYTVCLLGAVSSSIAVRWLKKNGYPLFS